MQIEKQAFDLLQSSEQSVDLFVGRERFPEIDEMGISLSGLSFYRECFHLRRRLIGLHMLVLTAAGKAEYKVGAISGELSVGDALFIPAGSLFEYQMDASAGEWKVAWFMLKAADYRSSFPKAVLHTPVPYIEELCTGLQYIKNEEHNEASSSLRTCLSATISEYVNRVLASTDKSSEKILSSLSSWSASIKI